MNKTLNKNLGLKQLTKIEEFRINQKYLLLDNYSNIMKEIVIKEIHTNKVELKDYFSSTVYDSDLRNGSKKVYEYNSRIFQQYKRLEEEYKKALNNLISKGHHLFLKEIEIGEISEKVIKKVKKQTLKFLKKEIRK